MTMPPTANRWLSRREVLQKSSVGFGQVALASLLAQQQTARADRQINPLAPRPPQLAPRARSVIFCFMQGGPSHVDTFDYKPLLTRNNNKTIPLANADGNHGRTGKILKPFWRFRKYGQSGIEVSDLFPHIGRCVDDICFINSMYTAGASHFPEQMRLHTGSERLIRPTLGSWVLYGLGTENENLPGFITICPCYNFGNITLLRSAFLPSAYQMVPIGRSNAISPPPSFRKATFRHTRHPHRSRALQRKQLDFVSALNRRKLVQTGPDAELEGRIASFETAFRMQTAAPPLLNYADETAETLKLYGVDKPGPTETTRGNACSPAGWSNGASALSSCTTHQTRMTVAGISTTNWPDTTHPTRGKSTSQSRPCSSTSNAVVCSTRLWLSGVGNSAAALVMKSPRNAGAATTIPGALRSGWQAVVFKVVSSTEAPTSTATTLSKIESTFMICTPPSCTCLGWTTGS